MPRPSGGSCVPEAECERHIVRDTVSLRSATTNKIFHSSPFPKLASGHATGFPIERALSLQQRDQARRVPATAAHFLHLRVELVDQRGGGQMRAVSSRLGQAD